MIEPDTAVVFVYGTLRCGGSNAFRMDAGKYLGPATVEGRLYKISWYPGLVLEPGAGEVSGDLFEMPLSALPALDEFEGLAAGEIEGSEYRRVLAPARLGTGVTNAWVYEWVGAIDESAHIPGGDWLALEI